VDISDCSCPKIAVLGGSAWGFLVRCIPQVYCLTIYLPAPGAPAPCRQQLQRPPSPSHGPWWSHLAPAGVEEQDRVI
jgi:hypothetical protein